MSAFAALALACWLLGVPVDGCDPRAQAYAEYAAAIPPEHWSLVAAVRIEERSGGRTNQATHVVTLPARTRGSALRHEVGHVLANRTPGALEAWRAAFWPDGAPGGELPPYPRTLWDRTRDADLASREDLAESYAHTVDPDGDLDEARRAWLTGRWPILAARRDDA